MLTIKRLTSTYTSSISCCGSSSRSTACQVLQWLLGCSSFLMNLLLHHLLLLLLLRQLLRRQELRPLVLLLWWLP
jgi:hypothetical protein